jgi:hypothetical protein
VTSPKIGPFYTSAMNFYKDICAERGDYTCIVCQIGTTQADDVAICYATGRATFSHAACLTSAGIPISDDRRARQKAKHQAKTAVKAVKDAENLLKRVGKAQAAPSAAQAAPAPIAGGAPTPDETVPVDEAALREQIEAEYDELLTQAIDRLKTMSDLDRIAPGREQPTGGTERSRGAGTSQRPASGHLRRRQHRSRAARRATKGSGRRLLQEPPAH